MLVLFEYSCTSSLSDTQIRLSWQDQSGNYCLVDLITKTVPYVATVPDFWVKEDKTQCWYPKTFGDRAALKRKPPQPDWYLYQCRVRGTFGMFYCYCYFAVFHIYNIFIFQNRMKLLVHYNLKLLKNLISALFSSPN